MASRSPGSISLNAPILPFFSPAAKQWMPLSDKMAATVDDTKLKSVLKSLPDTPGVYLMKDAQGRVLYIGKAKILKNRVSTYFHESYGDARLRAMIAKIEDVDTLQAPSEVDALLMEARLIKDVKPRYNDRLK